jgi:hypothetical protein
MVNGELQSQLINIEKKIPKEYNIITLDSAKLKIIKDYIDYKNIHNDEECLYLLSDYNDTINTNFNIIYMASNSYNEKDLSTVKPVNNKSKQMQYKISLDDVDRLYVFVEKDDKVYIFCIYDTDGDNINKIVGSI